MDDEFDIAREEMYARLADELYSEHKEQAARETLQPSYRVSA